MGFARLGPGRIAAGLAALAAVGLIGGYAVAMRSAPKPVSLELGSPTPQAEADDAERVYVHVGGAVVAPGLYVLREGARVDDAIKAAGGATSDADVDSLNLAALLRDGDKVAVPRQGESGQAAGGGGDGGGQQKINLNTASAAELETLPGIGPALAQRITAHREQHGGFRTVEDILKVSGIGPAKFEAIRDLVSV